MNYLVIQNKPTRSKMLIRSTSKSKCFEIKVLSYNRLRLDLSYPFLKASKMITKLKGMLLISQKSVPRFSLDSNVKIK